MLPEDGGNDPTLSLTEARPKVIDGDKGVGYAADESEGGVGVVDGKGGCGTGKEKDESEDEKMHASEAWEWFRSVGSPKSWLAPMVGQSDPAFRMLARKYGADICHTEMIDAGGYANSEAYRKQYPFSDLDRPLVVQLGGSNVEHLAKAAALVAPHSDAVELNVGCPQRCARKGGYGSFLMDTPEHLCACVRAMSYAIRGANPACACLVKIRCFDEVEKTVELAKMLVKAGCQCLTVHGRTRRQGGGKRTGKWPANWGWIAAVKRALPIPVISNGNLRHHADIAQCLKATGADGIMSGCGALKRPFIFSPSPSGPEGGDVVMRISACTDYLELAKDFPPIPKQIMHHLASMLPQGLGHVEAMRDLNRAIKDLPTKTREVQKSRYPTCPESLLDELLALLRAARGHVLSEAGAACALLGRDSDEDEDEGGGSHEKMSG